MIGIFLTFVLLAAPPTYICVDCGKECKDCKCQVCRCQPTSTEDVATPQEEEPKEGYTKIFPIHKEKDKDGIRHIVDEEGNSKWPRLYKARKNFWGVVNGGISFVTSGLMLPEKIIAVIEYCALGLFILLPIGLILFLMSPKKEAK